MRKSTHKFIGHKRNSLSGVCSSGFCLLSGNCLSVSIWSAVRNFVINAYRRLSARIFSVSIVKYGGAHRIVETEICLLSCFFMSPAFSFHKMLKFAKTCESFMHIERVILELLHMLFFSKVL